MKILFLGTPLFAVPSLEILKENIIGVVTHPDRPKGRNLHVTPPPVKIAAQKLGLPVYQPECVSSQDFINELRKIPFDLIVTAAFGEILSKEVLEIPKIGCINLHASLLPKYRGAAPVAWALLNGEKVTGVTTFWLAERMDSGDIIMQMEVPIYPNDTRGTLSLRLSEIGSKLLFDTVNKGLDPSVKIPQDDAKATYAPKLKKTAGKIDWKNPALDIHNKIRAMNPWPAAFTFFNSKRMEIWKSSIRQGVGRPGTVVLLNDKEMGIATGREILLIEELQIEGKKRIPAPDFIHGYRIKEGMKFG